MGRFWGNMEESGVITYKNPSLSPAGWNTPWKGRILAKNVIHNSRCGSKADGNSEENPIATHIIELDP